MEVRVGPGEQADGLRKQLEDIDVELARHATELLRALLVLTKAEITR